MQGRHRSFRPTQPEYMRGKRVKRRLCILAYASSLLAVAVLFLTLVASWVIVDNQIGIPAGPPGARDLALLGTCLVLAVAMGYLTYFALKRLFIRLGFLTLDEASFFPIKGDWPESWLEPTLKCDSDSRDNVSSK